MDFIFELDTEAAETAGGNGGSFGTMETGVYDVTIETAVLGKTKSGNNKLDISFKTAAGHEQTIYQAFVLDKKWATGSDNFGYADWQAFASVTGMKGMTAFQKPIMKDDGTPVMVKGTPLVLNAVKELEGVKLKLAIVKVFDYYAAKSEVTEKNEIFASFTEAGLSASEKINGSESTALGKLDGRLNDKKTKGYKKFIADGGSVEDTEKEDAPIKDEDLGL